MPPASRPWNVLQRHTTKLVVAAFVAFLLVIHMSSNTFSTGKSFRSSQKPASEHAEEPHGQAPKPPPENQPLTSTGATYLSPAELMARPLVGAQTQIPKLFHQSWSSNELPAKFKHWAQTCMDAHPDWEWVLWTDDDNMDLVRKYFPTMMPTFDKLPGPIFQADLVRNAYMYLFGGVYSDLDMECLRPSDDLFARYNVSTASARTTLDHALGERDNKALPEQKAFVGRMGTDNSFEHSIPNAWMASTPGHPFFKLMLEWTKEAVTSGKKLDDRPEAVTGPIALKNGIERFEKEKFRIANIFYPEDNILSKEVQMPDNEEQVGEAKIEILESSYIYPYSWSRDGDIFRSFCSAASDAFNATRCKEVVAVDRWPSWAITYWSHTWEWTGHNDDNLKKISSGFE